MTMNPSQAEVERWRREFPILARAFHGKPLIYLDNAATTQKPRATLDALDHYYKSQNANIHRGVYALSQEATAAYEQAREKVRRFINAELSSEVIFTRGTTESINLVAATHGRANLKPGDEIVISAMEHHSNIVPWQMICQQTGATLRVVPMNDRGELLMDEYAKLLNERTRIVAIVHVSNSLGTINPVSEIICLARQKQAIILLDGAQWVGHHPTDVQKLDADFYAFSGHKLFGPTGIGVLYGKQHLLESMPPYQGGGDMIRSVTFAKTEYADPPNKFEAGTPNIAGAIGLGAAIDFVQSVGWEKIAAQESLLLRQATEQLSQIPGLRLIGAAANKAAVISFVFDSPPISSLDLGMALDAQGIAVRTGHHCCQPVMERFGIPATARASFALYNTITEVDALAAALRQIVQKHSPIKSVPTATETELKYPRAAGVSPQSVADELAENFELLGDADARSQYVLDLGARLLTMPQVLKTPATRVHGCMSTVHLYGRKVPGSEDRLDFLADSDAHIVRGLIAILEKLFAGQRAGEILEFDVEAFFRRIGLDQFISTQRRNGLAGMVKRIRALAGELIADQVSAGSTGA
jgi:cysteine desulfurase/selenocysteine lyase